jgi:hypothetical protein
MTTSLFCRETGQNIKLRKINRRQVGGGSYEAPGEFIWTRLFKMTDEGVWAKENCAPTRGSSEIRATRCFCGQSPKGLQKAKSVAQPILSWALPNFFGPTIYKATNLRAYLSKWSKKVAQMAKKRKTFAESGRPPRNVMKRSFLSARYVESRCRRAEKSLT